MGLFLCLLLGFELRLVGLLCRCDLIGDVGGVILQLVHLLGIDRGLAGDLGDHRVHIGLLRHQVGLLGLQVGLGSLFRALALLQIGLGVGHGLAGRGQLVHDLVVIVHDLRNGIDLVQQVRKTVGIEQHGQVGHVAPLLHAAHPLAVLVVILRFLFFGLGQLLFLLDDHLAQFLDGLLGQSDLLFENVDLLFQQKLLIQSGVLGIGQLVQLFLKLLLLGIQLGSLRLQVADLLLGHSLGTGHRSGHSEKDHHHCQDHCANSHPTLLGAHSMLHCHHLSDFACSAVTYFHGLLLYYNTICHRLQEKTKV